MPYDKYFIDPDFDFGITIGVLTVANYSYVLQESPIIIKKMTALIELGGMRKEGTLNAQDIESTLGDIEVKGATDTSAIVSVYFNGAPFEIGTKSEEELVFTVYNLVSSSDSAGSHNDDFVRITWLTDSVPAVGDNSDDIIYDNYFCYRDVPGGKWINGAGVYVADTTIVNLDEDYEKEVSVPTAIQESLMQDVSLYPNPTTGLVYITGLPADATVEVFTLAGGRLSVSLQKDGQLDLSKYPAGVYVMVFSSEGVRVHNRVVIKN
jgi:hypothetical protein